MPVKLEPSSRVCSRLAAILACLLTLAACAQPAVGRRPTAQTTPRPRPQAPVTLSGQVPALAAYQPKTAAHVGGTATIGVAGFPSLLSPVFFMSAQDPVSILIYNVLFSGLIDVDSQLKPFGDMATQLPTVENGGVVMSGQKMDVTYTLRPGLEWSDGQPITADDVIYTWQTITDPNNPVPGSAVGYDQITGIDKVGDSGLVMHFKSIYPTYYLLFGIIMPRHRLGNLDVKSLAGDPYWHQPDVVSGPFTFKSSSAGRSVTLMQNPHYAAGRTGMPLLGHVAYLDQLVFRSYPSTQAELADLVGGQLQAVTDLDERDITTVTRLPDIRYRIFPSLEYEQLSFNQSQYMPWADDPQLLEALDLAIDRPSLSRNVYQGDGVAAATPISPNLSWLSAGAFTPTAYDPSKAAALLDQDGWVKGGANGYRVKNGAELDIQLGGLAGDPVREAEEEIIGRSWQAIGANVSLADLPNDQLWGDGGAIPAGQYAVDIWSWEPAIDPDSEFDILASTRTPSLSGGQNYSRCSNQSIDQALQAGRSSLVRTDRMSAYHDFATAYRQARCEVPLFWRPQIAVNAPSLQNYAPTPIIGSETWNAADWWISK